MTSPDGLPWFDVVAGPAVPDGAPVVVLLHAFPLSSTTHERLVPLLANDARVVVVDLPGLGRSVAAARGEPSIAAMADAVLAVLDHLDVAQAHVCGTSTGGYVALEMVARAPERVASLTLSSTTTRVIAPDVPADRLALAERLAAAGDVSELLPDADQGLGDTARHQQPELVGLLRDVVASADPAGVAWVARALAARRDTSADLAAYPGPVLLLNGAEDTDTPPARGSEMRALRGPRPTHHEVLGGTGHLAALEQPEAVAQALRALVVRRGAR